MTTDKKNSEDIEIIPPDLSHRRGRDEWVYISFEDNAKAFNALPLHKRILYGMMSLLGALLLGIIIFLIFASVILIWIPLILALVAIAAAIFFVRTKLMRR